MDIGTVMTVVDVVRSAIDIYKRIQDGPAVMSKIERRMRRLENVLMNLEHHLRSRSKHALARLRKTQTEELLAIIEDTRSDVTEVHELFYKWDNQIGPWGLQFRFKTVAQAYFTLGTRSDRLDSLAEDIELHRRDIDTYLGLIGVGGMQAGYDGIQEIRKENEDMKKQLQELMKMMKILNQNKETPPVAAKAKEKQEPQVPLVTPGKDASDEYVRVRNENKTIRIQLNSLRQSVEKSAARPPPVAAGKDKDIEKQLNEKVKGDEKEKKIPKDENTAKKAGNPGDKKGAEKKGPDTKEPDKKEVDKKKAEKKEAHKDAEAKPAKPETNPPKALAPSPKPRPTPSPSPLPPRDDYHITFVDPSNEGRSVIASATMALLRNWTVQGHGTWRVKHASSRGFYVDNPTATSCNAEITALLARAKESYKKPLRPPGSPDPVAVAALFDNSAYSFLASKAAVRKRVEERMAKGVEREIFRENDYIVVFTAREHENLLALRKELVEKYGKGIAPKGKGRLLHLGHYLRGKDGVAREIVHASVRGGKGDIREKWNIVVGEIKTALKKMLKDEFGWKQPDGESQGKVKT